MKQSTGGIAVEGRHIIKNFRVGNTATEVLKDISLQIEEGEYVAIMGPSGSGKSTLLYILGGLDAPTSGHVLLNGTDISRFGDEKMSCIRRQKIGFVFQFYNLIPNLNVEENILLPLLLDGKKVGGYKKQLEQILEIVGLSDRRRHTPRELSGGQQQRVAIARAVVTNPKLILADEPTGNLDSKNGAEVMNLLTELNKEGTTIIMVTHSQHDASFAHRTVHLFDGSVVASVTI